MSDDPMVPSTEMPSMTIRDAELVEVSVMADGSLESTFKIHSAEPGQDDLRRMTSVEVEECTVAHYRTEPDGRLVQDQGECSKVKARKARCASGLHNYVVPRSYVQIGPKRYVQVCFQCGQTDYMDGVAPE